MIELVNEKPEHGEDRYWTFISPGTQLNKHFILLAKVVVENITWDYENEYDIYHCRVTDIFADSRKKYEEGEVIIVDHAWQLQKTIEQAKKLIFYTLFKAGVDAFFYGKAPF